MSATCPVCGAEQGEGLLCHGCTTALERDLGDVPAIVAELDITLAKQARLEIAAQGALARERDAMNNGALLASNHLNSILTSWARDVSADQWRPEQPTLVVYRNPGAPLGPVCATCAHHSCKAMRYTKVRAVLPQIQQAASYLLGEIPAIRRHPAVRDLAEEVNRAIWRARRAYDRPANRTIIYVGPCPETVNGEDCPGSVFAFIPVEDDKPGRMECDAYADHKWSSIQWYRAGKRILDKVNERKRRERIQLALYGQAS